MTWLTSPATTRIVHEMEAEHRAYLAAESRRAPLAHQCGCCPETAYRIETCASGELAIYDCDACHARTVVDLTRLPRVTEQG